MINIKVLELFAGTRSIGKTFEARGHEVYSVDWDKSFDNIDLYADIATLTAEQIIKEFGRPDVIWASPDCTSFSIAAISHHRKKNEVTGNLDPVSDYAKFCDKVDQHVIELIKELKPKYYFIENPRGGMRKMTWMQELPRYTVTYCFKGDTKFITKEGHKTFQEMENKSCFILNKDGEWEEAKVRNYGKQKLYRLTLSRAGKEFVIYTTKNHKWLAAIHTNKYSYKTVETKDLIPKMYLPYAMPHSLISNIEINKEYVCRGFIFGDGWVLRSHLNRGSFAQFCNDKDELIPYFEPYAAKVWRDDKPTCKITKMRGFPTEWKTTTPTVDNTPSEIYSWLIGYFAADGTCSSNNGQATISSAKIENLQLVKELAEHIGIGTGTISEHNRKGYNDFETPLYYLTFMRDDINENFLLRQKHKLAFLNHKDIKHQPRRWSVVSVKETNLIEDVYCCETKTTHTFTLENNIVTHNCQYGDNRMKPTDLWTNHPNPQFKPPCHNGDSCHVSAPRGSKTGTQGLKGSKERSIVPQKLCEHIVDICEESK